MNSDFVGLEIKWATAYVNGNPLPLIKNYAKHGMRRKFRFKDYIIKVDDRGYCNYEQSTKELEFWENKIEQNDRKYFLAPVGGKKADVKKGRYIRGWIAQPFVNIKYHSTDEFYLPNPRWQKITAILQELSTKYSLGDLHCNWIITDKNVFKILDWGV